MSLTALVLAGGAGRRMRAPKAAVEVHGESLAERAVRIASGAGCTRVVVVARRETPLPVGLAAEVVHDPPGDLGPLATLCAGLAALPEGVDVLVLGCDLPHAAPVLARLAALRPGSAAVAHDSSGRPQPLCARFPRDAALAAVRRALAAGDRRLRVVGEALSADEVAASDHDLLNVNTPDDLAAVRPYLRRGAV